jgi:hydroxyacylglutathione hydrolase
VYTWFFDAVKKSFDFFTMIIPIPLRLAKAFLVNEDGAILIDTGCPGEEGRIVAALRKNDVPPEKLRLILHTHGHYDHCGSTAALKRFTAAPTAVHRADVHLLRRGRNDPLKPVGVAAHLVKLISYKPFDPLEPDVILDREMDLRAYGIKGRVLFTPGHTAGSISVLLDDGSAMVGDLMVGGYLGGWLFPGRPGYHWFADDLEALKRSIKVLLRCEAHTLFVAHGGPLARQAVLRRFKNEIGWRE